MASSFVGRASSPYVGSEGRSAAAGAAFGLGLTSPGAVFEEVLLLGLLFLLAQWSSHPPEAEEEGRPLQGEEGNSLEGCDQEKQAG